MPTQISDYLLSDAEANKTGFRSEKRDIPFFDLASRTIKVKVVFDKFASTNDFNSQLPQIRQRATNRIMLHYFPEYYSAYRIDIRDKEGSIDTETEAAYERVRTSISNPEAPRLTAVYYEPASPVLKPTKHMVLVTLEEFGLPLTYNDVTLLKANTKASMASYNLVNGMAIPDSDETLTVSTYSPKIMKDMLGAIGMLPDIDEAIELFNVDEGIKGGSASTTLVIGSLLETNNLVNDGLSSFQRQLDGFPGALPINLDFNSTQQGMMKILHMVVAELMKDLTDAYNTGTFTLSASQVEFTDADLLVLHFGNRISGVHRGKPVISGISYVVNEISLSRQTLRTGYMTNILYNVQLNDPLILATLKNYEMLVRVMGLASGPNAPDFSFIDFLGSTSPGDFGLDSNFVWDDLPKPVDTENLFLKEAAKYGVIDLGDVKNLEKGFKLALSPKEMREYRQKVRENPEVYKKVVAANKAKALKTAMDVTKGIEGVLEGNFPGIKKNSKLGLLLRKIGIDELAKEAMICATFGLAPAFARLLKAVSGAIRQVGLQIYEEPEGPKNAMSMPEIDLSMFEIFTVDGQLWPQIRKMLIDTLMESLLEIVKALAALLKELCKLNNPRADDYGANDLADLVANNLNDSAGMPNISNQSALNPNGTPLTPVPPAPVGNLGTKPPTGPLAQVFAKDGFSYDQIMKYLRDLSAILSSMDICFLFMNRAEVPYETIEKIIDFNLEYPDLQIRTTLNTYGAIIGFFANLSRFVDLTDFCNEIANELFQANIDNLCLLEEAAPDRIDELLQRLADGLPDPFGLSNPGGPPYNGAARPPSPGDKGRGEGQGINLQCPDRPNFIANPLFNDTIPGLLQTVVGVIEEDFVNSVGAAQQALKEPRIADNPATRLMGSTLDAAGVVGEGGEELSKIARQILERMQEVFASMGSMMDTMEETCDIGEILGLEADVVGEVIEVVVDVMNEMLNDPEFAQALGGIEEAFANIANQNEQGGSTPPAITYDFPASFTQKFQDYMGDTAIFDPRESFSTLESASRTELVQSGKFYSTTPQLFLSNGYDSYKPPHLTFAFPAAAASQWQAVPGSFYGSTSVPKYQMVPSDLNNEIDALTIKFPTLSTIEADTNSKYIDVSLKSKLLPTYEAAIKFGTSEPPTTIIDSGRDTNPYAALFTDALIENIPFPTLSLGLYTPERREQVKREVDTVLFPAVYAGFVESAFDYVQKNGIFDITRLNSLNFFHDNANCLPEDVADLLDVSSILEELNDEMLDALCYDADSDGLNPMGTKIREVIRYGLFLLLIQIHIAQFIIKNIFVFSAFEIDHILGSPLVREFMSVTIREQVERYVRSHPMISEKMVEYFNKKIKRPYALQNGGLLDHEGEVVFPEGMVFGPTDFPAIIEYLTGHRIMNSKRPVSNAVKASSSLLDPKPFNKAFIEDILTFQPGWFGAWEYGTGTSEEDAYVYVHHNPNIDPGPLGGSGYGKYSSLRRWYNDVGWGNSLTNLINRTKNTIKEADITNSLAYGKIVLERQVVWDSVESTTGGTVPEIISNTSGQEYGLEFDLFKTAVFGARFREALTGLQSGAEVNLRFTNLNIRYNVVYYFPESLDIPVEYTPKEIARAFIGQDGHPMGTIIEPGTTKPPAASGEESKLFTEDWGNLLAPRCRMSLGENINLYRVPLKRLDAFIPLANEIATTQTESKFVFVESSGQYERQDVPILRTQLGFYNEEGTNSELLAIAMDPVFEDYFGKTFSRDVTTLIPVMHNFYLTTQFFPAFDKLLGAPKARCVQIFTDTVLNENAITDPRAGRPGPQALAAGGPDILSDLQQSALEFILKMLIETPINILRGISEMMDPHVALSKIIRDITGAVFYKIGQAIDVTPPIQFLKDGPPPDADGNSPGGLAPGISGEGVLKLLFCLLTLAMKASQSGFHLYAEPPDPFAVEDPPHDHGAHLVPFPPPISPDSVPFLNPIFGPLIGNPLKIEDDPDSDGFGLPKMPPQLTYKEGDPDPRDPRNNVPEEIKENFFPRITVEGVDFTGTFLGLLMLPPGPFGIVYLLLMLLKNALEDELKEAFGDERSSGTEISEEESGSEC